MATMFIQKVSDVAVLIDSSLLIQLTVESSLKLTKPNLELARGKLVLQKNDLALSCTTTRRRGPRSWATSSGASQQGSSSATPSEGSCSSSSVNRPHSWSFPLRPGLLLVSKPNLT